MNGRCETDPLDRAVDVCNSCYGEFCAACLARPKGHRHPVCTECTLIASGVRGKAQPQNKGSRRTAKKRREALKEQRSTEDEKVFAYFDAADPEGNPDSIPSSPSQAKTKSKTKSGARKRRLTKKAATKAQPKRADIKADNDDSDTSAAKALDGAAAETGGEDNEPATPAVAQLTKIRKESARSNGNDPADTPLPEAEVGVEAQAQESEPKPSPSPRRQPSKPNTTAKRTKATPKTPPEAKPEAPPKPTAKTAPETNSETPPKATPEPKPKRRAKAATKTKSEATPEPKPKPMAKAVTKTTAKTRPKRTAAIKAGTDAASSSEPTSKPRATKAKPGQATAAKKERGGPGPVKAKGPTNTKPRRRKTDTSSGAPAKRPSTAPMIGEVRTIGGRRSSDAPEPAPPATDQAADQPEAEPVVARNAIEEFDAGLSAPHAGDGIIEAKDRALATADRSRADTDVQGNWIPPILRGMAPDAREAKANLPQRRRKTEDG